MAEWKTTAFKEEKAPPRDHERVLLKIGREFFVGEVYVADGDTVFMDGKVFDVVFTGSYLDGKVALVPRKEEE